MSEIKIEASVDGKHFVEITQSAAGDILAPGMRKRFDEAVLENMRENEQVHRGRNTTDTGGATED